MNLLYNHYKNTAKELILGFLCCFIINTKKKRQERKEKCIIKIINETLNEMV